MGCHEIDREEEKETEPNNLELHELPYTEIWNYYTVDSTQVYKKLSTVQYESIQLRYQCE